MLPSWGSAAAFGWWYMLLIVLWAKPTELGLDIVSQIALPMILGTVCIGLIVLPPLVLYSIHLQIDHLTRRAGAEAFSAQAVRGSAAR